MMFISTLRRALLATVATTPLLATPLLAQNAFDLGEIIVSGGLSPIEAARYGLASSLVTATQIAESGIITVQDALRALPGVSVSSSDAGSSLVRIRGREANQTLLLIDGVEASGGGSEYAFSGLETANIERIEVLRGPQSVYYGSNASAGVINIITKKAVAGESASGSVEFGAATNISSFFGKRTERMGLSLSLSRDVDTGYYQSGDGGEKDEIRQNSMILSGDFLAAEGLKLGFTLRRAAEKSAFDAENFVASNAADYVQDDPTVRSTRDETAASVFAEYAMMEGRMTYRLAFDTTTNKQTASGCSPARARYRHLNTGSAMGWTAQSRGGSIDQPVD
jgi:vitamin B12 transporter